MAYLLTPPPATPHRQRQPSRPVQNYETWSTKWYWRKAACSEVDCDHWREGWTTVLDEDLPEHGVHADYIRYRAGRAYREGRSPEGFTAFSFPPGQTCFAAAKHKIQAEREPLYVAQTGDWRKLVGRPRVYDRGDQFADDLHIHTDKILRRV